jgi:hypothetical protein
MARLMVVFGVWCLVGCSKEPPVAEKPLTGASGTWVALQNLLGEGIAMGPERLGTTLHDQAATSRCIATRDRLQPQVAKLRAEAEQLSVVSLDDLSACVDCATGGDQACSRVSAALERAPHP